MIDSAPGSVGTGPRSPLNVWPYYCNIKGSISLLDLPGGDSHNIYSSIQIDHHSLHAKDSCTSKARVG